MFPQQNDGEKDSITIMGKEQEVKAAEAKLLIMIKDLVSVSVIVKICLDLVLQIC